MSWIDDSLIGQYEELAADAVYQRVEIATSEVGPAYAALEEHIAREHAVGFVAIEHDAARRVPRHMDHFQLGVAEGHHGTIV